jgi:arylsulfatase A-like enzyme
MVSAVDTSVGRVIDALEQSGMTEETIIIFFSDNGGLCTRPDSGKSKVGPTSNLPLRSGKGWLYEGGIREPLIIRVPGMTNPGTQCDTPVISMDFFPTIIELAGLPLAPKLHVDGISLVPLLKGEPLHQARSLYWHYPHYHGSGWRPGAAIRENDWKLIEFYESDETELYDLSNDSAERNDLSTQFPDETIRLKAKLSEWQSSIGAAMPEERPKPDI